MNNKMENANLNSKKLASQNSNRWNTNWVFATIGGVLLFLSTVIASTHESSKVTALILMILAVALCVLQKNVKHSPSLIVGVISIYTLICGISSLYASSGKYAISEYLKIIIGFCLFIGVIILEKKMPYSETKKAWTPAVSVEIACAIASFLSIDLVSTRIFSNIFASIIGVFTVGYSNLQGLEIGSRITSIYQNPNVFAGVMGISIFISLALVLSSKSKIERICHLSLLFICAMGFTLAFSIGAFIMFVPALILYFFIEKKIRITDAFLVTLETIVVTFSCAFAVYTAVFDGENIGSPIPLLVMLIGGAILCFIDWLIRTFAIKNPELKPINVPLVLGVFVASCVAFAILALNVTGSVDLLAGEKLTRTAYIDQGNYSLSTVSDNSARVLIESKNTTDLIKHTSTVLYSGNASDANFDVPSGSKIVAFTFTAENDTVITDATYSDGSTVENISLNYKLLPGFISNRLQGLLTNQNAIQRFEFFKDGLKIFSKSPVFGLGLGAFQNWVQNVQDFYYETKYAHNHYIEMLLQGGIIGFASFIAILAVPTICIIRELKKNHLAHEYSPALGAVLAFMALHALIEVNFSMIFYIPVAFWVFAIICICTGENFLIKSKFLSKHLVKRIIPIALCLFIVVLSLNMYAKSLAYSDGDDFTAQMHLFELAANMDLYENADYSLSYLNIVSSGSTIDDQEILNQAEKYAQHLAKCDSRTVPWYLSLYYLTRGDSDNGFKHMQRYVYMNKSSEEAWQKAFSVLSSYIFYASDYTAFRTNILNLYDEMLELNQTRLEQITLSDETSSFILALAE